MTTITLPRAVVEQALETLEQLHGGCTDSDDGTVEAITVWCPEVIEALRAALAQQTEPQATPAWWRDGLTATLMREGINKHRAREIADGYWDAYCGIDGLDYE